MKKNQTRLGVAKGEFEVPEPDPVLDAEIARMFLGEDDAEEPDVAAPLSPDDAGGRNK